MSHNAADRAQVREARRKEKQREHERIAARAQILNTIAGRRFVWDLLSTCRVFGSVMDARSGRMTAYNSGRQDVGHELMAQLYAANPDGYASMQREGANRDADPEDVNEQQENADGDSSSEV